MTKPISKRELERAITEVWRPLFDPKINGQEMAYLIRQCKDETNALIDSYLESLIGEDEWPLNGVKESTRNELRAEIRNKLHE